MDQDWKAWFDDPTTMPNIVNTKPRKLKPVYAPVPVLDTTPVQCMVCSRLVEWNEHHIGVEEADGTKGKIHLDCYLAQPNAIEEGKWQTTLIPFSSK